MPGENQPSCCEDAACTYLSQPAPASAHALRQSAHQPASAWRRPYPRRHRTPCAAATAAAAPLPPIGLCCREVCAPRTRRSRRASRLQQRRPAVGKRAQRLQRSDQTSLQSGGASLAARPDRHPTAPTQMPPLLLAPLGDAPSAQAAPSRSKPPPLDTRRRRHARGLPATSAWRARKVRRWRCDRQRTRRSPPPSPAVVGH
jgi:hypothetical protein